MDKKWLTLRIARRSLAYLRYSSFVETILELGERVFFGKCSINQLVFLWRETGGALDRKMLKSSPLSTGQGEGAWFVGPK